VEEEHIQLWKQSTTSYQTRNSHSLDHELLPQPPEMKVQFALLVTIPIAICNCHENGLRHPQTIVHPVIFTLWVFSALGFSHPYITSISTSFLNHVPQAGLCPKEAHACALSPGDTWMSIFLIFFWPHVLKFLRNWRELFAIFPRFFFLLLYMFLVLELLFLRSLNMKGN
jgi:hypothetical protein